MHQAYFDALKATGVHCLSGHFVIYSDRCNACGHSWNVSEEKQSDVNLALSVLDDAHEDRFDVCYLITTDGDHAATARFLKERFPKKRLVIVTPPDRTAQPHPPEPGRGPGPQIGPRELHASLLPARVETPSGALMRPAAFDPPPRCPGEKAG